MRHATHPTTLDLSLTLILCDTRGTVVSRPTPGLSTALQPQHIVTVAGKMSTPREPSPQ